MSLTGGRPLETTDYLWVLSRQLDRVAELATAYFKEDPRRPAVFRAKAFIGSVLVAYAMSLPVIEQEGKAEEGSLKRNYYRLAKALADPVSHVREALEAWSELLRALHISGLLYRTGGTPIQV